MKNKQSYIIIRGLQMACALLLFCLLLSPAELRWAEADLWLAWALPVAGLLAAVRMKLTDETPRWTIIDGLMVVGAVYLTVRAYVGNEWPCGIQWLKVMEMVLLYGVLRLLCGGCCPMPSAWLIGGIVAFGFCEAVMGLWQLVSGSSRHHLFAMTGSFLNPGPFSASLMMASVVCSSIFASRYGRSAAGSPSSKGIIRRLLPVVSLLLLVVLAATWSRAAWMGWGVSALWLFRDHYRRYRYPVWLAVIAFSLVFYFMKQGSADGRLALWTASLLSWSHSPWIGMDMGGFQHACAEGMAELWQRSPSSSLFSSAGVVDYACNEWLKILVEQGLVGVALAVMLIVAVMCRLYRQDRILFFCLFSLLVFSLFSYPFEMTAYRIVLVALMAWSASRPKRQSDGILPESTKKPVSVRTVCMTGMMAVMIVGGMMAKEIHRRWKSDQEASLFMGSRDEAFLTDYYELLPDKDDDSRYLFDFAMALRDDRRYRDSNDILRMGTKVSADPMFYVIMGNNFRDEGCYDMARLSYEKAFAVMPNRLYPLYRLMLMYKEMGEKRKSVEMARRIVRMTPKVESGATREMKREAEALLVSVFSHPLPSMNVVPSSDVFP